MKKISCFLMVNNTSLAQSIKKSEEKTYKNLLPVVFGDAILLIILRIIGKVFAL